MLLVHRNDPISIERQGFGDFQVLIGIARGADSDSRPLPSQDPDLRHNPEHHKSRVDHERRHPKKPFLIIGEG